jgi:extracellular elastinolytic metalloproteinase
MPRRAAALRASALALMLVAGFAGVAEAQPWRPGIRRPQGFLSGPRGGDAREVAERFIRERHALHGIASEDLARWRLGDRTVTASTGVTHVNLQQQLGDIDVRGGELTINVMPDGRAIGLRHRFVRRLARAANVRAPRIAPRDAIEFAAEHLGLAITGPLRVEERKGGAERAVVFDDGGISLDPIPVKLVYIRQDEESMRLAWELFVRLPDQQHWWNLAVDAVTGEILSQVNWILHDSYTVFPLPYGSPDAGPRSEELDPADSIASPYGWHDDDGSSGADHTTTVGNNAITQEDINGNNGPGAPADGGPSLDFDFPLDLSAAPASSLNAALTNVFYWTNRLHDIHYAYGFDEASGNYQNDNYGEGGLGGDPVRVDAQDGSAFNNANFSRAPEGFPPRMQMFLFQHPGVVLSAPSSIAQTLAGGTATFGPSLTGAGVTGTVVLAEPPDACSPLTNGAQLSGKIALIDRGDCLFIDKIAEAQAHGAIAAIIVNNAGDDLPDMGGSGQVIAIEAVLIGQSHGDLIKSELSSGVTAKLTSVIYRDSDYDNTIISHEYGHGVSIRLSGGPSNAGCLSSAQSAGMGEGWSDFWALALTANPDQKGSDPRPIGTWVQGEGSAGPGIRNKPYTTDMSLNTQTLATIGYTNQPHGVGEVWAQALWEMYWLFVGHHGYDPDLYSGSGGNNLALQLVMDALPQQGCQPTFLEARDAIFDADTAANGGANHCLMWQAFAKRGMGEDAVVPASSTSLANISDGFAVPAGCEPACGNSTVDLGESCDDGGTSPGDGCSATCNQETFVSIFGEAEGGSVSVTVDGVVVTVSTQDGDQAPLVRQALASAINEHTSLSVSALVVAGEVVTEGDVTEVSIDDPGLSGGPLPMAVPALGPAGIALVIATMALSMLTVGGRRRVR